MNKQILSLQKEIESKNRISGAVSPSSDEKKNSPSEPASPSDDDGGNTFSGEKSHRMKAMEEEVLSIKEENGQLKTKVTALEDMVHHLEKYIKKMKSGLKEREKTSSNLQSPSQLFVPSEVSHKPLQSDATTETNKAKFIPKSKVFSIPASKENTFSIFESNGDDHLSGAVSHRASSEGEVHPGVFSKADKPDRVKPLTRIL